MKWLGQRLKNPEGRDQIYRIVSITLILIAIGACGILVLAFMMEIKVLLVVFSGVFSMALAFYLFIRLWPRRGESETHAGEAVSRALEKPKPKPLSPEEYRRQRELAQKMIKEKAAPALAKAIRGILLQDEMKQKQGRRRRRK